jgi:hypothetical protein
MSNLIGYVQWVFGKPENGERNYPILTVSIIGNVMFLVLLFFKSGLPKIIILLFGILLFVPPTVFGYSKRPFFAGVRVGTWPLFSLGLELGNHGIPTEYIVNMIQSGIFYGGLGLPVATIFYGIGIVARERRLGGERARRFAWQALLMLALTIAILMIRLTTNLLNTDVVH